MKVAIHVPRDIDIWKFHTGLIRALLARNIDVTVICAPGEYRQRVQTLDISYIPIGLNRFLDPVGDIRLLWSLYRIFCREKFDVVHNHTIKPNIYGTLAARLAGVGSVFCSVRGLGSVFGEAAGRRGRALQSAATAMYRFAFLFVDRVQFLNPDDLDFFVSRRVVRREKAVLIRSSGVNLGEYSPDRVDPMCLAGLRAELGIAHDVQVVTMVARPYWCKGVREFVAAAERLGAVRPVKFLLAGAVDSGPDVVPVEYLEQHRSETFQWLGYREDIRELLALSDVVVLPSYYPEGIPRSLLEALAMCKPIVTTDHVGCRETVDDGLNGYLVPPMDSRALANAIQGLLDDGQKRERFGRHSRAKVEAEFDERIVVDKVLRLLYGLDGDTRVGARLPRAVW